MRLVREPRNVPIWSATARTTETRDRSARFIFFEDPLSRQTGRLLTAGPISVSSEAPCTWRRRLSRSHIVSPADARARDSRSRGRTRPRRRSQGRARVDAMDQSRWGVDPLDEGDAAARAAGDAALVVSAASAKRWKDALDAKGWLDARASPHVVRGERNRGNTRGGSVPRDGGRAGRPPRRRERRSGRPRAVSRPTRAARRTPGPARHGESGGVR